MMANSILFLFIKYAFAGTGSASDINSLIIIIVLFLAFILAIVFMVSFVRRYLLKRLQNRNGEKEDILKDYEIYDDFDYF